MTQEQRLNALYAQLATDFSEIAGDTATTITGIWNEFYLDSIAFKTPDAILEFGDKLIEEAEGFGVEWFENNRFIYDSTGGYEAASGDDILVDPTDHIRLTISLHEGGSRKYFDVSVSAYGKIRLSEEF